MTIKVIDQSSFYAESDLLAMELANESAAHFTAAELMWLNSFIAKLRWGTSDEQEKKYLDAVKDLKARVEKRKSSPED